LAPFRIRVNISAIGSLIAIVFSYFLVAGFWPLFAGRLPLVPGLLYLDMVFSLFNPVYQLDFTTPGSFPFDAKSRKQIRQTPNFRINALGRPQIGHLL
jgi:hypothetical protein